jgi:nucleoside-diphosphate-sugar epimerase
VSGIVLTGASGFIGRRLAARLAGDPRGTLNLVHAGGSAYEQDGQDWLRARGIPFRAVDLVSGRGLEDLPRRPSILFHLAASTDTATTDHRCNDLGTRNLIEALGPWTGGGHVLFTSSLAVTDSRADYSRPLAEGVDGARPPRSAYGRAKLAAEAWLGERARIDGFSLTILRLATVYGSGPRPTSLFDVLQRHVRRRSLIGRLDWPGRTGFVHVDDVVEALVRLAERPPRVGETETYIVHAESVTLARVSELLHGKLGVPYRPVRLPRPLWGACAALTRRAGVLERRLPLRLYNSMWRAGLVVDNVFWCDTDKLERALPGWKPRHLEDAIADTLAPLE